MTLPLAIGGDVFVGLGCYGLIAFADMSGLVDSFRDRASAVVGAPADVAGGTCVGGVPVCRVGGRGLRGRVGRGTRWSAGPGPR